MWPNLHFLGCMSSVASSSSRAAFPGFSITEWYMRPAIRWVWSSSMSLPHFRIPGPSPLNMRLPARPCGLRCSDSLMLSHRMRSFFGFCLTASVEEFSVSIGLFFDETKTFANIRPQHIATISTPEFQIVISWDLTFFLFSVLCWSPPIYFAQIFKSGKLAWQKVIHSSDVCIRSVVQGFLTTNVAQDEDWLPHSKSMIQHKCPNILIMSSLLASRPKHVNWPILKMVFPPNILRTNKRRATWTIIARRVRKCRRCTVIVAAETRHLTQAGGKPGAKEPATKMDAEAAPKPAPKVRAKKEVPAADVCLLL